MNQYEIELRDKYFETGFDYLKGSGLSLDGKLRSANDFADKCMAERQKHLDMDQMVKAQEDGYAAHKVQGTECER